MHLSWDKKAREAESNSGHVRRVTQNSLRSVGFQWCIGEAALQMAYLLSAHSRSVFIDAKVLRAAVKVNGYGMSLNQHTHLRDENVPMRIIK